VKKNRSDFHHRRGTRSWGSNAEVSRDFQIGRGSTTTRVRRENSINQQEPDVKDKVDMVLMGAGERMEEEKTKAVTRVKKSETNEDIPKTILQGT